MCPPQRPAARAARQALAPIEHWRFGAAPSSHLGGVGLDLMLAFLAPHDEPEPEPLRQHPASSANREGISLNHALVIIHD